MAKDIKDKPWHPLLFASYPVLALLAYNIEEIKALTAFRALLMSVLAAGICLFLLNFLMRNPHRAAMITSVIMVLFFTYGHVYNFLRNTAPLRLFGRHQWLLLLWVGIFVFALWLGRNRHVDWPALTRTLNLIGALLLIFPLAQLSLFALRTFNASELEAQQAAPVSGLRLPIDQPPPDVYYIILDAYARDDVLRHNYRLENRDFLAQLEELGFYVARCSQSNYSQTQLSLASSLNFKYLSAESDFDSNRTSRVKIKLSIHQNAARNLLEGLGYKSVAFETGFKGTQWEDADSYLAPRGGLLGGAQILGGINPFEEMLVNTSAGRLLEDGAAILPAYIQPDFNNPLKIHRERILFVLEKLDELPNVLGPKLVFAHLVIPHPPYVFGPNGEVVDYDKPDDPGYQDQIIYLNKTLIPILKDIIQNSSTPPIILLQADHGAINASPAKRTSILSAYFLPNGGDSLLYENISPVNSFRVIFDYYFGGQYDLLEDISYFSIYSKPYDFTVFPEQRPGCP